MKTLNKILMIMLSLIIIGILGYMSYSYYAIKITGESRDIKINSVELKMEFSDSSEVIAKNFDTGWTDNKTLTVKYTGDNPIEYKIAWETYENSFTRDDFVYSIVSTDGGANVTETKVSEEPLTDKVTINPGETHTYNITFTYKHLDNVDQSADMGKTLKGKLTVIKE